MVFLVFEIPCLNCSQVYYAWEYIYKDIHYQTNFKHEKKDLNKIRVIISRVGHKRVTFGD